MHHKLDAGCVKLYVTCCDLLFILYMFYHCLILSVVIAHYYQGKKYTLGQNWKKKNFFYCEVSELLVTWLSDILQPFFILGYFEPQEMFILSDV